jgi:ketol-acid reductoisomerase|tara:strand:- start:844 stop:1143 length:300 start_codon:yes stop_codon:yes gene_type:complete
MILVAELFMSMIGVSVASSKSLQLEATQEAYNRAVVKLNLLLIDDKTHEEVVRSKLFEVMDERNQLGKYSTSDLYVMQKSIEKTVDDFLTGLNEQTTTA